MLLLLTITRFLLLAAASGAAHLSASSSPLLLEDNQLPEGLDYFVGTSFLIPDTGGVTYRGGRLLVDPITVYLIWFGNWPESSRSFIRNSIQSLSRPSKLGQPDLENWWKLTAQYTDDHLRPVSSSVSLAPIECSASLSRNLTRELVADAVLQAFSGSSSICNGSRLPQDEGAVYHLLFSREVTFAGGEFTWCTRRLKVFRLTEGGEAINMAWTREPGELENCGLWDLGEFITPVEKLRLDSLVSFTLAQIVAQATNADFRGWQTEFGAPVTSMCMSPSGLSYSKLEVVNDYENSTSWNLLGEDGYRYLVQQVWNQRGGHCALQYLERCDELKNLSGPSGIISYGVIFNHSIGLQGYSKRMRCKWSVKTQDSLFIRLKVNYQHLARVDDELKLFGCGETSNEPERYVVRVVSGFPEEDYCVKRAFRGVGAPVEMEIRGQEFSLVFTTGLRAPFYGRGWEMEYRAGYCSGIVTPVKTSGVLTDGSPAYENYLDNHTCGWLVDAGDGARVSLEFTRFNTVPGNDLLTIYRGKKPLENETLRVYQGSYSSLPRETFTGPVLLIFSTQTSGGLGWELKYTIEEPERSSGVLAISIAFTCGSLGGIVVAALIIKFFFRPYLRGRESELTRPLLSRERLFSREEIAEATEDFSRRNLLSIATGGSSRASVYAGVLEGQKVVVKRSAKGLILGELLVLSAASKHSGVVNLTGYCLEKDEGFLVMENASNGSLAEHLFSGKKPGVVLSWGIRLRVALQIALALEYLHGFLEPSIAHGNISSENVLLDKLWNAKLAGFGSSSSCGEKSGSENFKLRAGDVYRFGGVLIELVTGKRAGDDGRSSGVLLDERIEACGDWNVKLAVMKMAEVGAWCMSECVSLRPTMVEVASALRQVVAISLRSRTKL